MATQRLTGRLKDLGVEEDEAEIYVYISAMGPTPARAVARRFNMNRMRVYRSLNSLEEKKLVQKVVGRPVKFVAMPLRGIIERQIGGLKQTLTTLQDNADSLVSDWENLSKGATQTAEEPRFRIIQGRQQIFDTLFEMFSRANRIIRLVLTPRSLARFELAGLDDKLKELKRDGREVRILTQIDEENIDVVESYKKVFDVRHIALQTAIRFAIIDDTEALRTVAMDDSMSMTTMNDTGLWMDSPNYVIAERVFFDALWSVAGDADSIIHSIRTGEPQQEIKTYTAGEDNTKKFSDMISRASSKIDLIVNDASTLQSALDALKDKARQGVGVRLITQIDDENLSQISAITEPNMIVVENATVTDLSLLLIDGKEALMNVPYFEGQKRTVWSNINAYVETMALVFRDYWSLAKPIRERLDLVTRRKRVESIASLIREGFIENGWIAEVPGIVSGRSQRTYMFDVVVQNNEGTLCMDVLTEGSVFNRIIERSTLYSDLPSSKLILASLIPSTPEELRLAELYRIEFVHAESNEELATSIVKNYSKQHG